ncbi:porin [Thermovibrio sp.]
MRKALASLTLLTVSLSLPSYGQELSNYEILQKLNELEAKVEKLERENRELRSLLEKRGVFAKAARKEDRNLKIGGRILFRFSQTQNINEAGGKSIYGDPGNGFTIRKARIFVKGKVDDDFKYKVQIRADKGAPVELWDAYITYSPNYLPISVKVGQFKVPLSLFYLHSGTKLGLPERPLAVNKIAPVWRDVGVELSYEPVKGYKVVGAVINGEGWSSDKIYNSDKKYAYLVALQGTPVNTSSYLFKFRIGYETGTDHSEKLLYRAYNAYSVKRHLIDAEAFLKLRDYSLALRGGYLFDNPTDGKDQNGNSVPLGNAKGYYLQADYGLPFLPKLHLVGRYSWLDGNTDKDDKYDLAYTTVGAYYLIHGWQTVVRTSYTFANQRKSKEIDDNLFTAELQLLF